MKTRNGIDRFSNRVSIAALYALVVLALVPAPAAAFVSGSDGTDGAFTPTVDTQVDLTQRPSGIFNYTSVNIPAGVTVTFKRNATNTPVIWLVQGNVTIAGTVDLRGQPGVNSGAAGNGNIGDDGLPGIGGPGGFDGGRGGASGDINYNGVTQGSFGGSGLGPGAGGSSNLDGCSRPTASGGGGFGTAGAAGFQRYCGGARLAWQAAATVRRSCFR